MSLPCPGAVSGVLQGFGAAAIRSQCSSMVPSNEQGKGFYAHLFPKIYKLDYQFILFVTLFNWYVFVFFLRLNEYRIKFISIKVFNYGDYGI